MTPGSAVRHIIDCATGLYMQQSPVLTYTYFRHITFFLVEGNQKILPIDFEFNQQFD